jgi:hypothetical protein
VLFGKLQPVEILWLGHDARLVPMRRLIAADLVPERAGQPVKAWAHISLADLLKLDGNSALQDEWTAAVRAEWAAHRADASAGGGSDGGAWLDGEDVGAIACDAAMTPVVTGEVNPAAPEDLVRLCVQLDEFRHGADRAGLGTDNTSGDGPDGGVGTARPRPPWTLPGPGRPSSKAIIGKTMNFLLHS